MLHVIFPANQRIRFRGINGPSRAAALARELDGRCTVIGGTVFLTEDVEFGPRLFDPEKLPFKTETRPHQNGATGAPTK